MTWLCALPRLGEKANQNIRTCCLPVSTALTAQAAPISYRSTLETASHSIKTSKKLQENARPLPIAVTGQSNPQSINGTENTGSV